MEQKLHPLVVVMMLAVGLAATEDLLGSVVIFDPVVLADNYYGHAIQVRQGQVVRKTFHPPVDPNTITVSSDAVRWSRLSDPRMLITQADFEAVHPGVSTIKIKGIGLSQFGPVYYSYDILVRDRARPYDLALSESTISSSIWNPSGFALRVGDEIVVASSNGTALTTDSSVVVPTVRLVLGEPVGFTTFRAVGAGTAQIGLHRADGYWLPATIVVSNSSTRFDLSANQPDDGKVIQIGVGHSLRVTLKNLPNHQPWYLVRSEADLMLLVDPQSIGQTTSAVFGFQAVKSGSSEIRFRAEPTGGCPNQTCVDQTPEIHLSLQIAS